MDRESQLRADIVEIGRRLWVRGFVASNDGNISIRLGDGRLLMTPTNVSKGFMTADMMVITDLDGRLLSGAPGRKPSSEMQMHLVAYRQRPDINAVVHAHPPLSTGFAVAGIPLDRAVLAEVIATLGSVPIADYGTPSTKELAGGGRAVRQDPRRAAARQPRRAYAWQRRLFGVLQDGDDRALRAHQPDGPAAWPRAPAVARGGHAGAGAARFVWHCVAGADLPGPAAALGRRRTDVPGGLTRRRHWASGSCPTAASRWGPRRPP